MREFNELSSMEKKGKVPPTIHSLIYKKVGMFLTHIIYDSWPDTRGHVAATGCTRNELDLID